MTDKIEQIRLLMSATLAALDHAEELPFEFLIGICIALDEMVLLIERMQTQGGWKSGDDRLIAAADRLIAMVTNLAALLPTSSRSAQRFGQTLRP